MLTQEQAVEIKVLKQRGAEIREIARELGCLRDTIRRYSLELIAQQYSPRLVRSAKLDSYKNYLLKRIEAARPQVDPRYCFGRSRSGHPGGLMQLKEFLSTQR